MTTTIIIIIIIILKFLGNVVNVELIPSGSECILNWTKEVFSCPVQQCNDLKQSDKPLVFVPGKEA